MRPKLVMAWSSGKDSAMALQVLLESGNYDIVGLMTSISERYQRISHHGVRVALLEDQASALGLPLRKVMLPSGPAGPCTNDVYEQVMEQALLEYQTQGVTHVAFGDLYLQDLRAYRERSLAKLNLEGVFPLWMRDTTELAHEIIRREYKAIVTCVEPKLGPQFVGRHFDDDLLLRLPPAVDPCGENGEFHTFVYDGPIFPRPLRLSRGQIVCRDGRHYADLLPAGSRSDTVLCKAEHIPPV